MRGQRTHTIQLIRDSIGALQRVLETEQRIATGSDVHLAEQARAEIPRIQARIAEAEARVRALERSPPA
jgi:hypothetical protein